MTPAPAVLLITVTEEDILTGERRDVGRCPVARAACRALGAPVAPATFTASIIEERTP